MTAIATAAPVRRSGGPAHRQMMAAYWAVRQAEESALEAATGCWPGDVDLYLAEHPRTLFRDWLKAWHADAPPDRWDA